MQMQIDENTFWLSLWTVIGVLILAVVISSLIYTNYTNEKILKADSCVKVLTLAGGSNPRYLLCTNKDIK